MMRVKNNDIVVIITGKDKGKRGKVLDIDYKHHKVKVQGVAIVTRHLKPRRQGEKGTLKKEEGYIDLSNVMPLCPTSDKPCRVRVKELEAGTKVRVSHRSQEAID